MSFDTGARGKTGEDEQVVRFSRSHRVGIIRGRRGDGWLLVGDGFPLNMIGSFAIPVKNRQLCGGWPVAEPLRLQQERWKGSGESGSHGL